ncbi:MAG: translocation/assembly module TamB [Gammaproteobacteria bacterium]|nr:translocation/assembly module TamB [Gammaproteobacteria bacterium]
MKLRWYHLKNTLLTLLMLILVLLAIAGTNLSLQLAKLALPQFVTGLQIGAVTGDLWRGAVIEQLSYQDQGINLTINRLETQLNWHCLSARKICLDYLTIEGSSVDITPAPEITAANELANSGEASKGTAIKNMAETQPAPATSLDWAIKLDALNVKDFRFTTATMRGSVAALHSAGNFTNQQLSLLATTVQGVQLTTSAPATTKDDSAFQMPDLTTLTLPLAVNIDSLTLTDATLQQPDQAPMQLSKLQLSTNLQQQQWQLDLSELVLTTPSLQAQAKLEWTHGTDSTMTGQFHVELPELVAGQQLAGQISGPLKALALQLQLSGAQQATANATFDFTQPQLPFSVELSADALYWPLPDQATALYRASAIAIQVDGDLDQQQFSAGLKATLPDLPNSALQVQGQFQPSSQQLTIKQLNLSTLNGEIQGSGLFDLAQQQLTSQWQLHQVQPGLYWTDYAGEFSGSFDLAGGFQPQLHLSVDKLNIDGQIRDLPLNLAGSFKLQQQTDHWQVNTKQLLLKHGPNKIDVSGGLDQQWQLAVLIDMPDLAASISQSEGQINGKIDVSGPAAHPDLLLRLSGKDLNYQDDYALNTLELTANIADWGNKSSTFSLIAGQGQAPGLQLQQLDWQLSGTRQQHSSHFLLNSHQLQAVMAMEGQFQQDSWQAQWQELRLKSDVGDWQLNQPVQSNWSLLKQQLSLTAFCLQDKNASLCVEPLKQASLQKGQLQLALTAFEMTSLNALLSDEQSISGQIDGQINLGWQKGTLPTAQIKLEGNAGKLDYQSTSLLEMRWQKLDIDASLNQQQLNAHVLLQLATGPQSKQSPEQNSEPKAELQLAVTALDTSDKQLDARLQLQQFDLAFLQPLFSEFSQFSAEINGDVHATGSLDSPLLNGQVKLEKLSLNGRQAPMEIADSSLTLAFSDKKALLSGALKTPDGPLNVSGDADWQVTNGWFGSARLSGKKLKLHLPNASFSFSPDLLFSAEPREGLLSGEILLENGKMEVDALPENAIRVSDDEVIRTAAVIDRSGLPPWKLRSDVRLTLGENVRLAAFGLDTKLLGVLRIRQQGLVPTIHGQVTLKDGTFRAYGQDLQLRKGKLTFNGPADQPLMAIEAIRNPEKTEDGVIAGIKVDGLTDNPVIKVFSTPAKPQANALAYLLLGRDLTSSSSDKSVTTSLIGIGIASSGKLVGQLGEVFGLRELSLDTAGSGDSSKVMVSGYLSPKLQLKYGVGIFNQVGEFTLRYRLARKLFLEAVRGLNESVDLLYQVEFD